MNDFKTKAATWKLLDPNKRVKYTRGLVLGVGDFVQEQAYHIEKNRLHNRSLHGYGTVSGLHVSVEDGTEQDEDSGPVVVVSPGLAINPIGQEIMVPYARCAPINSWLTNHKDDVIRRFGSIPPEKVSIYVVLCYNECETDNVIIAGLPCNTQEPTASRIEDSFRLSLRLPPPQQLNEEVAPTQFEEDAIRRFEELLGSIDITDEQGGLTRGEMEDLVRSLAEEGSPHLGSLPESLRLYSQEACGILHAAFRVWVTEVRPKILNKGGGCASGSLEDGCKCVRLAQLDIPMKVTDDEIQVDGSAADVLIDETDRPILLHTRLLQGWLMCGLRNMQGTASGIMPFGISLASDIRPRSIMPAIGTPPVETSLTLTPFSARAGASGLQPGRLLPFATINRIGPRVPTGEGVYEVFINVDMFNIDTRASIEVDKESLNKDAIKVFRVAKRVTGYQMEEIEENGYEIMKTRDRNTINIKIDKDSNLLYFNFNISKIKLKDGQTVREYAANNRIYLIGSDGNTVIASVRKA